MSTDGGFWGTLGYAKASIDFCEPNFEASYYVAEPMNALSSLPYVVLGVFGVVSANGLRRAPREAGEWESVAFAWSYGLTAVIGAGSVALHSTLIAPGQAADEAPMLLLNLVLIFILLELESGTVELARPWLPGAFGALGVGTTAVYARYQAFYASFLVIYLASIVCIVGGCARLALFEQRDPIREAARFDLVRPLFWCAIASYALGGGTAWVLEFHHCAWVTRVLGPAFLHPLWHTGALGGTWLCVQLLSAARVARRGSRPRLVWRYGLPITAYPAP